MAILNVKGSLNKHLCWWKNNCSNRYINKVIETGYELPFFILPQKSSLKNNRSALDHPDFVDQEIEKLMLSGVIQVANEIHNVNPLTVAENSSGKLRLVIDLRDINPCLLLEKYKYEDIKVASAYFKKENFMCVFDLKSGYHHVDINNKYKQYLCFQWKGSTYNFESLPFGLSSAGLIFSKVLRELVKRWRGLGINIVLYLDDGIVMNTCNHKLILDCEQIRKDLHNAGFIVNEEKSNWIPAKKVKWLGFILDSSNNIFEVPRDKMARIKENIFVTIGDHRRCSAKRLAKAVGQLTSLYHVFGTLVYMMTKNCQCYIANSSSWSFKSELTEAVLEELRFWYLNLDDIQRQSYESVLSIPERIVYSDASGFGCGAFIQDMQGTELVEYWSLEERKFSSTWRELKAVELYLKVQLNFFNKKSIKWYTDNLNVTRIMHKGSMKHDLQIIALEIFHLCVKQRIDLSMEWIPRDLNEAADHLSKIKDVDDWEISKHIFDYFNRIQGPFTLDAFASNITNKVDKFYSQYWCTDSSGVDAFAFDWSNEVVWMVPPPKIIIKTILHCQLCKVKGLMIIPKWTSAPFWPLLYREGRLAAGFTLLTEFQKPRRFFKQGLFANNMFTEQSFGSNVLVIKVDCT